ncbi:transposase, partial [Marinibactrum halimedae]
MSKSDLPFDLEDAIAHIKAGKPLTGKEGLLTPLIKQVTEAALQAEQEQHIANSEQPNRKNGNTAKTMKTATGSFQLKTPRDRAGTFEPQIVKKHQTQLTDDLERKILALYAHGNSYQDIREHLKDYYDIDFSNGTLNAVTDKLLPELQAWRERDLDPIYPIVWLDAIHYKIKENGRFV